MVSDLAALHLIIHDLTDGLHPAFEVFLITSHGLLGNTPIVLIPSPRSKADHSTVVVVSSAVMIAFNCRMVCGLKMMSGGCQTLLANGGVSTE